MKLIMIGTSQVKCCKECIDLPCCMQAADALDMCKSMAQWHTIGSWLEGPTMLLIKIHAQQGLQITAHYV